MLFRSNFEDAEVLGGNKTLVTIVDYSSYNCHFCKKMREKTIIPMYEEYVKTGLVKYIHRPVYNNRTISLVSVSSCFKEGLSFDLRNEFFKEDWMEDGINFKDKMKVIIKKISSKSVCLKKKL